MGEVTKWWSSTIGVYLAADFQPPRGRRSVPVPLSTAAATTYDFGLGGGAGHRVTSDVTRGVLVTVMYRDSGMSAGRASQWRNRDFISEGSELWEQAPPNPERAPKKPERPLQGKSGPFQS